MALGVIGAGVLLVVEDHTASGSIVLLVGAAVTWLVGLWVMPWGIDAYSRKLSHIMRDWLADLRGEESRELTRLRAIISEVTCLDPPPVYIDLHQRVLTCLRSIDTVVKDKSSTFVDRAVRVYEQQWSLNLMRRELSNYPNEPYIQIVMEALDKQRAVVATKINTLQGSLHRCIERTQRLKPPSIWDDDHKRHLDASRVYLVAIRGYYDAVQGDDVEAVRSAAEVVSETHCRFEAVAQELSTRMVSRWTQPMSRLEGS